MKSYIKEKNKEWKVVKLFAKKEERTTIDYVLFFIVGFLVIVFFYMLILYVERGMTLRRLENQKQQLELQVEEKNHEIELLKKEIDNSKTPEYIEKKAREQLKMVMPDERVYIDLERKP